MNSNNYILTNTINTNDNISKDEVEGNNNIHTNTYTNAKTITKFIPISLPIQIPIPKPIPILILILKGNYNALEFRLAEARSKFARSSQMLEDQVLTTKNLERDLSYEIELRKHAEKERDAYMAAYEASIKHFEKFAAKRNK